MIRVAIIAITLLVGTVGVSAQEMPKPHKIALTQMATVLAMERFCPTFQANNLILGALLKGSGLKDKHVGQDGEYVNEITMLNNEAAINWAQETESQVCWTANYLYGPKGIAVPNLMIPR